MKAGRRWRGKCCFAIRSGYPKQGTPKQFHFSIPRVMACFIKKISDIRFCRWRTSVPNKSGLMRGGGGVGPPDSPSGSATAGGKFFNVKSCPRIGHANIRDIFLSVVNSRWNKMEGEKNALDAIKQLWEKEGGKINRVLLVWSSFFYSLKR